ncbi:MAG: PAS domain S-box protein [Actinomycetia bacterium]|nr:PAS domain S-box protein [Actinomycetes bacterium]
MRVLVVDDDPAGRYLLESIVRSGGHDVSSAMNGEEALAVAHREPPDLIVTDILMPKMDGYQLCRSWKSDDELCHIPLVFYTASYTDLADEQFADSLGADAFWRKPLDPTTMLRRIEEIGQSSGRDDVVRLPEMTDETEILQEYSERLVHKLEEKALDLEKANVELRHAMEILAEEVSVKANLIAELNADVRQRKKVEDDLRKERDFTREVLDHSDTFIAITQLDGKILLFSRGAETATGFTSAEAIGANYLELLLPSWTAEAEASRWDDVIASMDSSSHEALVRTKEGGYRFLELTTSVTADGEGRPAGINIFAVDITERRRAEVLESSVRDIDHVVVTGGTKQDLLQGVCDRLMNDMGTRFQAVWGELARGNRTVEVSAGSPDSKHPPTLCGVGDACPTSSGRPVMQVYAEEGESTECLKHAHTIGCSAVYTIPIMADGAPMGAFTLFLRDAALMDQHLAGMLETLSGTVGTAVTLLESRDESRLKSAALESSADAILIADNEGRIEWANRAFEELTGYAPREYTSMTVNDLMPDGASASTYVEAWSAASSGGAWNGETVGRRKDGSRYYENLVIAPVLDVEGSESHFIVVKRDISQSRQLEQLRSGFVANVSHELRTPLTSIMGFADVLSQMKPEAMAQRAPQVVSKIRENTARMRQLVEELLEVTTIQEEGPRILKRSVDLEQVVRQHADVVRRGSDHLLTVNVTGELPIMRCDPDRLGRAVENLVANAVKYSPDGGPISVTISAEADDAVIAVTDRGIGIAPEDIPRLFDRFTQGDMSSTRAFGGLGIGLFVAEQIVEAHGGRIEVTSAPGKGSTFTIRVPLDGDHL